ncbi:MAG TPA: hypothetical protein VIC63_07015 [Candidatus Limnocylindria bacterium]
MSRRLVFAAFAIGVAGWLLIWFQTEPRANFDSLIYHTHALEYAGLDREEADEVSWRIFARYASDRERKIVADTIGGAWSTPPDGRWMDLYRMRPLYPLLVGAVYPFVGERAPMTVSAGVTVGFVVLTGIGFGLLFGWRVAGLATLAALLQVNFTHWLVFLSTDGLALPLWAASMLAVAMYARSGRPAWLAAIGLTVLALGITRPTSSLVPVVPALCLVAALAVRHPVWQRFGLATIAALVPAAGVVLVQGMLELPGMSDVLQEIPTQHFALPDIQDPIGYTIQLMQWALIDRLLPTLFGQPLLLATVVVGIVGLVVHRSWSSAVFLAGLITVPVAWLVHPVWFDAGRILSPTWVSLSLGVALCGEWVLVTGRQPIRRAVNWATRPADAVDEVPILARDRAPIPHLWDAPREAERVGSIGLDQPPGSPSVEA